MSLGACPSCGKVLEPGARFCDACGARADAGDAGPLGTPPPAQGAPAAPVGGPMPPVMMRPPRNPRQMASYAAGVMVLIAGIFGLMLGNMILFWDTWEMAWDAQTEQDVTVVNGGALFAGVAYVAGFVVSVISAHFAFRLTRYQLAVAGPVALLVAYFSTLAYESVMLLLGAEVLVLSVISLGLLYYAIPIFEGRATAPTIPSPDGADLPET